MKATILNPSKIYVGINTSLTLSVHAQIDYCQLAIYILAKKLEAGGASTKQLNYPEINVRKRLKT